MSKLDIIHNFPACPNHHILQFEDLFLILKPKECANLIKSQCIIQASQTESQRIGLNLKCSNCSKAKGSIIVYNCNCVSMCISCIEK